MVAVNGSFAFYSESRIDTYVLVHNESFDPFNLSANKIAYDDNSCGGGQFGVRITLNANSIYVLVVTTSQQEVLGNFTLVAWGPGHVEIQRISK